MKQRIRITLNVGVAFIFVTLFSYTTSPLYSCYGETPDSPIFQIIGKYWAEGAIPYIDLWDLKGPFIFFVNAIGYLLTHDSTGVYLIQVASLFLTLEFIQCILRTRFSPMISAILGWLSLLGLSYIYEGGNLTEEYLLPFQTLSFLFIIKWIDHCERDIHTKHISWHAGVYGMTLAVSLFSRLTNALPLCATVAVIAVTLLLNHAYRNLVSNILGFTLGFFVIALPFILYFHNKNALSEMWNATFVHAFKYAINATKDVSNSNLHHFILSYINSILLMVIALYATIFERKVTTRTALWLMAAGIPFIWFCQGNGFGHYGMTVYPLFAIIIIEMSRLSMRILPVFFLLMLAVGFASKLHNIYKIYNFYEDSTLAEYRSFLNSLPVDANTKSFVAYNCSPNYYLANDIRPAAPFFSLQDFAISRNLKLQKEIANAYEKSNVEWILTTYEDGYELGIQEVLFKKYKMVGCDSTKHLKLYHIIP